jgi:hypothetical protein
MASPEIPAIGIEFNTFFDYLINLSDAPLKFTLSGLFAQTQKKRGRNYIKNKILIFQ